MHYAVPRILQGAEMLERLFTDLDGRAVPFRWLQLLPKVCSPQAVRRLVSRRPEGIPVRKTTAFNLLGISYAWRRARARSRSDLTSIFLKTNRAFCRRVCQADWGSADAVYTFNAAGLEILQRARAGGLATVSEQTIAPAAIERRILAEERELHPGWEAETEDRCAEDYIRREQAEWPLADIILCGSEFVREGVRACGGPHERCVVVPYGVDIGVAKPVQTNRRSPSGGALRVLTVGTVSLRKGAPYVLEAARHLQGKAVFRMVGPSVLTPKAEGQLRSMVECTGSVPRSEVVEHYAWADVFLLPSLCEGSATATYEALAHGLPVVCTHNTGSVIRDGIEGFLVPVRDPMAIVARLQELHQDRDLLGKLSQQALGRAGQFTLGRYAERLLLTVSRPTVTPAAKTPVAPPNGATASR